MKDTLPFLGMMALVGLFVACGVVEQSRVVNRVSPKHCHVFLFSGGMPIGAWETDAVVTLSKNNLVYFIEADTDLDYRLSGDIIVECGIDQQED